MKNRNTILRGLVSVLLFSVCAFAVQSLRASPRIGAVVQTWHYDPLTNIVTLKIVNTSHTDITAFNIAIKETYADGRVDDAAIQVAATFPMKKMEVGVVHDGPPFDVEEFVKQIGGQT